MKYNHYRDQVWQERRAERNYRIVFWVVIAFAVAYIFAETFILRTLP